MQRVIIGGVTLVLQEFLEQEVTIKLGRARGTCGRPVRWHLARAGQTQQEGIHEDSRKNGKRIVVLVAMGLWTDGSRKRRILDWEIAEKEEQAAWERLVQRLWERGVKLETGLQAIVRDRGEGLEQALDYVYGSSLVQ